MNPIIALIIANVIWGMASPIFKLSLQNIPPFTLAFIRFFFASILVLYFGLKHWKKLTWREFFTILVASFFGITINIGFYFLALPKTVSINAPIIASSSPIFLFFFSIFFLREKFHKNVFRGILIAFIGVLIIVLSPYFLDGSLTKAAKDSALEGNLYLIISTIGSVAHALILKKILKKDNHFQITLITFVFGALTFFPFMQMELQKWSISLIDYRGWLGIIFGVLFSSAIAYTLFAYGIAKIAAQEIGVFTYIDPVAALILAVPLLGEVPNLYFYLGSFMVFLGILFAEGRIHWHPFHKIKQHKFHIINSK